MGSEPSSEKVEPFVLDDKDLPSPPPTATHNERLLSALAYASQVLVPLVLPILLLTNRNTRQSGFVRHHATQAISLVVIQVVYYLLVLLLLLLLRQNVYLLSIGVVLLIMVPLFVSLFFAVHSLLGHWIEIPLITDFLKDTGLL